jgi:hypothetical protein
VGEETKPYQPGRAPTATECGGTSFRLANYPAKGRRDNCSPVKGFSSINAPASRRNIAKNGYVE